MSATAVELKQLNASLCSGTLASALEEDEPKHRDWDATAIALFFGNDVKSAPWLGRSFRGLKLQQTLAVFGAKDEPHDNLVHGIDGDGEYWISPGF